ncbi:hypothetical protein [Budvicia aquatica]|uniref:Uncharacterized protein n=1 Tax=Budvicia aquatica TaxID=82979 RepID=A0A2C6DK84_9GAMM|nr:hypothetical protein [Budvicia aquatica]PHI28845.1 hypothetical protein CRN84_05735 [Budvicia aquatica]VFS46954.1 Uncharacterised protein [Budvicia aquatica]
MNNTLRWFLAVVILFAFYLSVPGLQPDDVQMVGIWLARYLQSGLGDTDGLLLLLEHVIALLSRTDNGLWLQTITEVAIAVAGYRLLKSLRSK